MHLQVGSFDPRYEPIYMCVHAHMHTCTYAPAGGLLRPQVRARRARRPARPAGAYGCMYACMRMCVRVVCACVLTCIYMFIYACSRADLQLLAEHGVELAALTAADWAWLVSLCDESVQARLTSYSFTVLHTVFHTSYILLFTSYSLHLTLSLSYIRHLTVRHLTSCCLASDV